MSGYDGWLHEKDAKKIGRALRILSPLPALMYPVIGADGLLIGAGVFFGSFMGLWLSPDLDHMATTRTEYQAIKRGGPIGWFWVAFWTWYAAIIPHRSFWSHSVIGTLIRAAIFISVFIHLPVWAVLRFGLNINFGIQTAWPFYLGITASLIIHDAAHYLRDGLDPLGLVRLWK